MIEFSKKTNKKLKELLRQAYANELNKHLSELSKKFDDWKEKKTDCWELSDCIHTFHEGISHDLFNAYNARGINDAYMIARALTKNLIEREAIPDEAIDAVEKCVDFFEPD